MFKKQELRWGLLSTARINRAIIDPVRKSTKSKLCAVASRSAKKAADYAKSWSIPKYYSSYEALLEDPDIDIIYNSLPNSLHAEWSIRAMQHGKHVLCEKPIATTVRDIESIVSTAKETRMVITEAFMYRHHPQTMQVQKLIEDNAVGELQFIHGSFCYTNNRPGDVRFDLELGGGSLWDVGCYPISYAHFITGRKPIEVFGQQIKAPNGIDLFFAGQLLFPENILFQFECSFISPNKSVMEITGTSGRITIPVPFKPGVSETIRIQDNESSRTIQINGEPLYAGEVADIENAILNGISPRIGLEESLEYVETIEALYRSARTNRSIHM